MKKIALFIASFLLAFFITEIIVAHIVKYPKYGISARVFGIQGFPTPQNVYLPHSEYWTVEGGNKVHHRNNLGLPGIDVDTSMYQKYIYVIGNSYVQAYEVEPELMATSIFYTTVKKKYSNISVLNLGRGDQDVYDSYFKCIYYEKYYKPELIFLIIDNTNKEVLVRHNRPLGFQLSENFGKNENTIFIKTHNFIRNNSSLMNLVAKYVYDNQDISGKDNDIEKASEVNPYEKQQELNILPDELFKCIQEFNNKYDSKFVLISIIASKEINESLTEYCNSSKINFISGEINLVKYKLSGWGHLTNEGNKLLGELMYEAFIKYYSK